MAEVSIHPSAGQKGNDQIVEKAEIGEHPREMLLEKFRIVW